MVVMQLDSIRVVDVIPATPETIYAVWLDAKKHAAATGGGATSEPVVGGRFTAWDGYIEGTHQELVPGEKIVQRWRSTDFPIEAAHSLVEITLESDGEGTRVTIVHSEIPAGQGDSYKEGWAQYYFVPLKKYFERIARLARASKKAASARKAAAAAAPAKKVPLVKEAAKKAAKSASATKAASGSKKSAAKVGSKKSAAKVGSKKSAAKVGSKKTAAKRAVS